MSMDREACMRAYRESEIARRRERMALLRGFPRQDPWILWRPKLRAPSGGCHNRNAREWVHLMNNEDFGEVRDCIGGVVPARVAAIQPEDDERSVGEAISDFVMRIACEWDEDDVPQDGREIMCPHDVRLMRCMFTGVTMYMCQNCYDALWLEYKLF